MKVILLKEVKNLGKTNEVKSVSDGYARNFLIPGKLARPATTSNLADLSRRQSELVTREVKKRAECKILADKLLDMNLHFILKAGYKDRAFGSISARNIIEELASKGVAIEKDWLELDQPIKTSGAHTVKIKFPHQIKGEIKITVETEAANKK